MTKDVKEQLKYELKYGVYKYIYKDEVIYVGKSDRAKKGKGIIQRIQDHIRENEFIPYLKDAKVMYLSMTSCVDDVDLAEKGLIAQYCPILNISCKPERKSTFDYDAFFQLQTGNRWKEVKEEYLHLYDIPKSERKHTVVDRVKYEFEKQYRNYKRNQKSFDCYLWIRKKICDGDYKVVKDSLGPTAERDYLKIEVDNSEYYEYLPSAVYENEEEEIYMNCPGIHMSRSLDGTFYYYISEEFPVFHKRNVDDDHDYMSLISKTEEAYFQAQAAYKSNKK